MTTGERPPVVGTPESRGTDNQQQENNTGSNSSLLRERFVNSSRKTRLVGGTIAATGALIGALYAGGESPEKDQPTQEVENESFNDEGRDSHDDQEEKEVREITSANEVPPELRRHQDKARTYIAEKIFHGEEAVESGEKLDYRSQLEAVRGVYQYRTENENGDPVVANFRNPVLVVVEDSSNETDGLLFWAAPQPETGTIMTAPHGHVSEKSRETDEHEPPFDFIAHTHEEGHYFSVRNSERTPQLTTIDPRSLGKQLHSQDITGWIVRGSTQPGVGCEDMPINTRVNVYEGEGAVQVATEDLVKEYDLVDDSDYFERDQKTANELREMEQVVIDCQ